MSGQSNRDLEKEKFDLLFEQAKRAHDRIDERADLFNQAAQTNGAAAIRILLALNGGSLVALLAFVAGLAARANVSLEAVLPVTMTLRWFVGGVVAAGIAATGAYVVPYCYAANATLVTKTWEHPFVAQTPIGKRWQRVGAAVHKITFVVSLIGFGFFIWGMVTVQQAIMNLAK